MNKQQLFENIKRKKSFLCVGLDTDIKKIPEHLLKEEDPIFAFNKAIIDATADLCIAYKPNLAFYESMGVKGWIAFEKTVNYIKQNYPDQFIIADAKRGDIGNTSAMYARTFFEELDIDSVTVAPYMGEDSVTPFLTYEGKWVILLALTSNKGSHDFQLTEDTNGERLFEKVLRKSQDVRSRRHTRPRLRRYPQDCSRTLPIGSRRRRTRRLPGRSLQVWHEQDLRPDCQLQPWHHLRGQDRELRRRQPKSSPRSAGTDGGRVEKSD